MLEYHVNMRSVETLENVLRSMSASRTFLKQISQERRLLCISKNPRSSLVSRCPSCRQLSYTSRRPARQAGDDPNFMSIVDNPPNLIRTGKRHGPGLMVLGLSPGSKRNSENSSNLEISPHPHNGFRFRNLAGSKT
jgi:hypothetical protein